jgi:dipeptidyl-peptidase-4
MICRKLVRLLVTFLIAGVIPSGVAAQMTGARYARAEQFLGRNARRLVYGTDAIPNWLNGTDRFWYRTNTRDGIRFVHVDGATNRRSDAFDHARLASVLSEATGESHTAGKLPFDEIEFLDGGATVRFALDDSTTWQCALATYVCAGPSYHERIPIEEVASPDGRWIAFSRDENLWIRSTGTDDETPLTTDGEEHFGYAVHPENRDWVTHRRQGILRRPILSWSPDSRRIVTHKLDERSVEEIHHLETTTGRPILYASRYSLPGDSVIPTYDLHVFDVENGSSVRVDIPSQEMVNATCCSIMQDDVWKDVSWGGSGDRLYVTNIKRGNSEVDFYEVDARTGSARRVLRETSPTFLELNQNSNGIPNWRVVREGRDLIWFSQRDGWGHLYLYDMTSGDLRNQITSGPWVVQNVLHVDEASGQVYFTANGRDAVRDPYYRLLYRVNLDGTGLTLLTPEDANHTISMAPSGRYFVDSYSRHDTIPVTVLRGADGTVVQRLETGDASDLLATGWTWPTAFTVKARDGVTPVSGFLYFPTEYDPTHEYPIIDYIYPGPQSGPVGSRGFTANPGGDVQAMAELGFIVFTIDATGTPSRSKAFHDSYYGNLGDNGLPDHIAAMKQLAVVYPQIDLDRVGIFGHSGGGFSSTGAMLRYPDFFKVAVSGAGNHDNRSFGYYWGEKYHGLLERNEDGTDNYDSQANHLLAANLEGKLLLYYGTLDDRVHPNANLLLIDELVRHNKDFDLIVLPNRNHGSSGEPYVIRRRWDYFVEHLLGLEPPREYQIR